MTNEGYPNSTLHSSRLRGANIPALTEQPDAPGTPLKYHAVGLEFSDDGQRELPDPRGDQDAERREELNLVFRDSLERDGKRPGFVRRAVERYA